MSNNLVLNDLSDYDASMAYLEKFCESSFCPNAYKKKPAEAYIACTYGATLGLSPFVSLRKIAVINGQVTIMGEALKGLVLPFCKSFEESINEETGVATCRIVRKGNSAPIVAKFSWEDAQRAGLTNKEVWKQYPYRMLMNRARGYAIRDAFPDILNGVISREEAQDYPEIQPAMPSVGAIESHQISEEESQQIQEKAKSKAKSKADRMAEKLKAQEKPVKAIPVLDTPVADFPPPAHEEEEMAVLLNHDEDMEAAESVTVPQSEEV